MHCGAFDLNAACLGVRLRPHRAHGFIGAGEQDPGHRSRDALADRRLGLPRGTAILFRRRRRQPCSKPSRNAASSSAGISNLMARRVSALRGRWRLHEDGRARSVPACRAGDGRLGEDVARASRATVHYTAKAGRAHQANIRIIEAAATRSGRPNRTGSRRCSTARKTCFGVHPPCAGGSDRPRTECATATSCLLVGFGAGMTSASAVIRWAPGERRAAMAPHRPRHRRLPVIGLACAALEADGDHVAVTYATKPPPDDLFALKCDVTNLNEIDAAFAAVEERHGPVEVLVGERGHQPRRAALADERRTVHERGRHEPSGRCTAREPGGVPGWSSLNPTS